MRWSETRGHGADLLLTLQIEHGGGLTPSAELMENYCGYGMGVDGGGKTSKSYNHKISKIDKKKKIIIRGDINA